jgi:hypothetical protein
MTLARFQRNVVDNAGNIQASPTVTVRDATTNSLVSIYSDRAGTAALGNPFTGDANGLAAFYVAGGAYRITAVKGAFSVTWDYVGIGTAQEYDFSDITDYVDDADALLLSVPQNAKTTAYTLIVTDKGKHISITTGGVEVPPSIFAAGDVVSIYNNSGSNQEIRAGAGVTLRLVGTATAGNRTLAQRGLATILCVAPNEFVVTGGGIS